MSWNKLPSCHIHRLLGVFRIVKDMSYAASVPMPKVLCAGIGDYAPISLLILSLLLSSRVLFCSNLHTHMVPGVLLRTMPVLRPAFDLMRTTAHQSAPKSMWVDPLHPLLRSTCAILSSRLLKTK